MSPRNPVTRRSSRAPKLKKEDIGEGSSPDTTRQLEYASKAELVIKTSMQKAFIQPPTFGDTDTTTESKIILPRWGDLFNRINRENYPEFVPHSDSDVRVLDDQGFPNIQQSFFDMVAYRTPVFPCINTLSWITDHTDTQKCLINDENGRCVGFFLPTEVQKY